MNRRHWNRFCTATVIAAALLTAACTDEVPVAPDDAAIPAPGFAKSGKGGKGGPQPTDQHVVALVGDIPADFTAAVEALGGSVVHNLPEIGVATTSGLSDDAAATLAAMSDVEEINRDTAVQWIPSPEAMQFEVREGPGEESDQRGAFFFPFWQWNMRQIDADDAWLTTNQGAGATVAILDTGVDPGHFSLIGKVLGSSTSVLSPGSSPCGAFDENNFFDLNFHGTFVSALVSSRGIAMASVAPDADLIGVKVLNCLGFGSFGDVIAGMVYAANAGADIINMSLGALIPDDPVFKGLIRATNRAAQFVAVQKHVLIVAAAGNQGLNLDVAPFVHLPSQNKHVMSVGATGPFQQMDFDQLAFYTNFGENGVDVMAPGGNLQFGGFINDGILSACSRFSIFFPICGTGNFYLIGGNGTSFSAPHAAGTAAVVESQFPGDQNRKVLQRCVQKGADDLGDPGVDPLYGRGRINVLGAAACGK